MFSTLTYYSNFLCRGTQTGGGDGVPRKKREIRLESIQVRKEKNWGGRPLVCTESQMKGKWKKKGVGWISDFGGARKPF